jgi:transcriptional regulator with XRE-family HTH domain
MTPKKKTQKQLALEYGLSKATLNNYQKDGVDIHNKQQVLDYAMGQNVCNANEDRDLLLTEADVEDVVSNTPTMLQLKLDKLRHETAIKQKQDQLLQIELDVKRGDLISLTHVAESNTEIATKVKGRLKALCISLPPQLEGLNVRSMSKKIEESIFEVLESLYDELKITDE